MEQRLECACRPSQKPSNVGVVTTVVSSELARHLHFLWWSGARFGIRLNSSQWIAAVHDRPGRRFSTVVSVGGRSRQARGRYKDSRGSRCGYGVRRRSSLRVFVPPCCRLSSVFAGIRDYSRHSRAKGLVRRGDVATHLGAGAVCPMFALNSALTLYCRLNGKPGQHHFTRDRGHVSA